MLNKQNNYHIHHSIGHSLMVIGSFFVLFTITFFAPLSSAQTKAINAKAIIELSNQTRQQLNHPVLNVDPRLMSAAQAKAEDMAKRQYFAHFGPSGESPWEFFKQAEYSYEVAGENLAITNEDDAKVIDGWLDSPSHRANLLSNDYRDMGIGIASYGDYKNHTNTTVIVAFYGKSKTASEFTGAETTNPAGITTSLDPLTLDKNILYSILFAASGVIILGAVLELKHIRHNHHIHSHLHTA